MKLRDIDQLEANVLALKAKTREADELAQKVKEVERQLESEVE